MQGSTNGALVPLRFSHPVARERERLELVRLAQEERRLRRDEAKDELEEITGVCVDPLRRAQRRYAWLGGVGTVIGAVAFLLRGVGGLYGISRSGDTGVVVAASCVAGIGVLVSLVAAVTALRVQSLEHAFQDVGSALSRRPILVRVLKEMRQSQGIQGDVLTEAQLMHAGNEWAGRPGDHTPLSRLPWSRPDLKALARRLGERAFTEVLIAKGKECDVLLEQEHLDDGNLQASYQVHVTPRQARPESTASREVDESVSGGG